MINYFDVLFIPSKSISVIDNESSETYVFVKLNNVIPTQTVPSINRRNKTLFSFRQSSTGVSKLMDMLVDPELLKSAEYTVSLDDALPSAGTLMQAGL